MNSRAPVEAVCTIGRLLTPNIYKVTTLRSCRSRFSKPRFQIHCYEILGFPQNELAHFVGSQHFHNSEFEIPVLKTDFGDF